MESTALGWSPSCRNRFVVLALDEERSAVTLPRRGDGSAVVVAYWFTVDMSA
jgi:hypothetical protein